MTLKVLVLEDKSTVAASLAHALQRLGHEVLGIASNAAEMAPLLEQHQPDLVVINLDLGERQDGMGVAIVLESAGPLPVVFIVDPGEEGFVVEESRTIEGTARLVRPFSPEQLHQAIVRALHRVEEGREADL